MQILPFTVPQPDLGNYVAELVGGTNRYQEALDRSRELISCEFMITNLTRKLPVEQLEAEVQTYLLRRGFICPEQEIQRGHLSAYSSVLRYIHSQYPNDEWVVLINVPTSRMDVAIDVSKHKKKS